MQHFCGRDVILFQMSPECKHPLGAFLGGEKKCLGRIILKQSSTGCLLGSYYPSHFTQSMFSYPPLCQVFLRELIHFPIFSLLPLGPSFLAVASYRNSFIIQQAFIEHLICVQPKVKKTGLIVLSYGAYSLARAPLSCSQLDSCILTITSYGRMGKRALQGLFYKGTNPYMRTLPLCPQGPTSQHYYSGQQVSTCEFERDINIKSIVLGHYDKRNESPFIAQLLKQRTCSVKSKLWL